MRKAIFKDPIRLKSIIVEDEKTIVEKLHFVGVSG